MQRFELAGVPLAGNWTWASRRSNFLRTGLTAALALALGACASLPQAGPTGRRIVSAGGDGQFELVEVRSLAVLPATEALPEFKPLPPSWYSEVGQLGAGDTITVTFYEVGVRIFSGGSSAAGSSFDPAAKAERVGPVEIDPTGKVTLPYVGTVVAAGRTPTQLADDIQVRLRGKSEYPQVVVQLNVASGSTVVVGGEVDTPGRVRLTGAHERLLDVIALSGGHRGTTADILVRVLRKDTISEGPFEALNYSNLGGMPMEPGDRVELVRLPRNFSILGSANKVDRYDLPLRNYSLIEGLAKAGGPNENTADPGAVFVFRFVKDSQEAPERPVVYHLNMLQPISYLLAQKFELRNKDVVYIAGAEANQPGKLLQMIGQVFTPLVIAKQVTR